MDFVVDMPILQVLLLTIFFFALFVEIKTGGLGVGVLLGLAAAGVFFGSQYIKGLVDLYQIGIFLGGILCIILEIIMPTVGLLAGLGIAAMLYSVVLALGGDINAVYAMTISLALSVALFALIVKRLPSSRLWQKFVLADKSTKERGYVAADSRENLVGKTGYVLTDLRPAGSAEIDAAPIDVVSEGAFISKGEKVTVVAVHGSRVVVRRS
ncbi:MAG: serine protease [Selenomonadaceae bacterium]|nr:serine protease [Selenomonadaceae bacterium]